MNLAGKIICKSIGVAGMIVPLRDAVKISRQYAEIGSEHAQEHHMEKAYYSSRTLDKVSYNDDLIREKTFELRSKSPIPSIFGKIGGGFKGFMYGLANSLPLVICSAFAILGKNFLSLAGAIGIGAIAVYKVLREGFGLGKNNPMN
jgi:hypothetical protein